MARHPIALAIAVQPPGDGQPWHAALVTADGQRREFDSISEFVQFLVALSLDSPPAQGLR